MDERGTASGAARPAGAAERGRLLFAHAVATARRLGYQTLTIEADPFAEAFYRAMGAERVGEVPSEVAAGRMLPLLRVELRDEAGEPSVRSES